MGDAGGAAGLSRVSSEALWVEEMQRVPAGGDEVDRIHRLYLNGKDQESNWSAGGQIKSASDS